MSIPDYVSEKVTDPEVKRKLKTLAQKKKYVTQAGGSKFQWVVVQFSLHISELALSSLVSLSKCLNCVVFEASTP